MSATAANVVGQEAGGRVWRFGEWEFDERRHQLRVRGAAVEVEAKPLEVLRQLLIHAGEIVTKEELLETVWPRVMVVDGSLATAVSKLRKVLGGDDRVIVTIPRIGYRLGCPAELRQPVASPIAALDLQPGDMVPGREHWRLVRRLDPSAAGGVWLAENPKTCAVRVFKFAVDAVQLRSLRREVTLGRLLRAELGDRPEFVRILEWNFNAPPYFIESEYAGPNLGDWAEAQGGIAAVPLEMRLQLLIETAQAVAEAHSLGVLHKDIKPGNILVADDEDRPVARVADFGSGALLDLTRLGALGITNAGFTQNGNESGALTGTVLYIAPEVLAGQSPSPASDVYALGVLLYQLVVGEFRKPLSPGWEAEIEDPLLRSDIAEAACGDPARRLPGAAELVKRLSTLEARRAEREEADRGRKRVEAQARSREAARARWPWILLAGVTAAAIAVIAVIGGLRLRRSPPEPHAKTVALLPFQNASGDASVEFLRFALPDEIATTLSHMRAVTIRPFTDTSGYTAANVDVRRVGREAKAGRVVTGHYLRVGDILQITIEIVDVERDRLLWRDTVDVPSDNLLALQAQISGLARGKMAAALGASDYVGETYPPPQNEAAYALFLRATAVSNLDSPENAEAAALLERSVALDPSYAPAWTQLARRLYGVARFDGGGPSALQRSDEALEQALKLDPDSVNAATELIVHRTERGQLAMAYRQASDLLERRPDSSQAHGLMSYVLRYAGLLRQSAAQCEATEQLDVPWPACATTYMQLGAYARARSMLRPDLSSEWSRSRGIEILLRQGRTEEALRLAPPKMPGYESYRMLLTCAGGGDRAQIARMAAAVRPDDDPEVSYLFAGHLAYCGQTDAAIRMLQHAVAANFCSWPAVDLDPFFNNIRGAREFAEVRQSAMACQAAFVHATGATPEGRP